MKYKIAQMLFYKYQWAQGSREILKRVQNDGLCVGSISHSLRENKSACFFRVPQDDLRFGLTDISTLV